MQIGSQLDQVITAVGIPQAEIARRIGESPMWLSRRITGRVPLRADEIPALATALRMDVCDLACWLLTGQSSAPATVQKPLEPFQRRPLSQLPGMRELAISAAKEVYEHGEPEDAALVDVLLQITAVLQDYTRRIRGDAESTNGDTRMG